MRWLKMIIWTAAAAGMLIAAPKGSLAADFVVYSVYKGLDLGNPGETPQKDYYVNMGTAQGLRVGARLDVLRRVSTYDLLSEKLYKDVTFPIAKIRVIHVEDNAAVCRLDKMISADKTPAVAARAVMIGDLVQNGE
jgi:hypothetical protein